MANDKAIAEFLRNKDRIDAVLAFFTAASENHFDTSPEEINWGDAGGLGHVADLLEEALRFHKGDDEEAE